LAFRSETTHTLFFSKTTKTKKKKNTEQVPSAKSVYSYSITAGPLMIQAFSSSRCRFSFPRSPTDWHFRPQDSSSHQQA
jgi:hypothetical protein